MMHCEEIVGMVVLKMSGEGRDEVEDLVGDDDDDVHDGDDEHDDAVEDDGKGLADQSMWYDKEIHRILAMGMFRGMLVMYIVEACDGDCPNQLTIISSMSPCQIRLVSPGTWPTSSSSEPERTSRSMESGQL